MQFERKTSSSYNCSVKLFYNMHLKKILKNLIITTQLKLFKNLKTTTKLKCKPNA